MKNVIAKLVRPFWIAIIAAGAIATQQQSSFGIETAPPSPSTIADATKAKDALDTFRAEEQLAWDKWRLKKQKAALYQADSPSLGAAQPKVTIVEFFDYNCQYCRKVQPALLDFLKKNPDVQIVLKDMAFLSKHSLAVGKIVLAARKQKDISELHNALMNRNGHLTETAALGVAADLGFDVERLKADATAADVDTAMQRTRELATELRVAGTPLFIVGHTLISGALTDLEETLAKDVEDIRNNGCDVC